MYVSRNHVTYIEHVYQIDNALLHDRCFDLRNVMGPYICDWQTITMIALRVKFFQSHIEEGIKIKDGASHDMKQYHL